jgi:dTDP-4-dehydrorhamnose reductase
MSVTRLKILVTGASGQLGMALQEESMSHTSVDFIFASRSDLDIVNHNNIKDYLDLHKPIFVINTAAYTAVDKAESEQERAFLINEVGAKNIALACKKRNIGLIHISTDYVFDGEAIVAYKETDAVNPLTVYGRSKLAGERAIQKIALSHYYIIRTSWLFSKKGHNFYNTMLRLANEGKDISVVNDQWGSPTRAEELASAILHIAITGEASQSGVYHYTGGGECTWYAFAKAILEKNYPDHYSLRPVMTSEYPTVAKRPRYSVLCTANFEKTFGLNIMDWTTVV